jgi:hypothetical protein
MKGSPSAAKSLAHSHRRMTYWSSNSEPLRGQRPTIRSGDFGRLSLPLTENQTWRRCERIYSLIENATKSQDLPALLFVASPELTHFAEIENGRRPVLADPSVNQTTESQDLHALIVLCLILQ